MSSPWRTKKAFLYFGGAFIILLGAAIVLAAPYHYLGLRSTEGESWPFGIWDRPGYYPQLEVSLTLHPVNTSVVLVDFMLVENSTRDTHTLNFTMDETHLVPDSNPAVYVHRQVIDLPFGNYTITIERANGTGTMDVGFKQLSDSRLFIVTGGSLNIIGLFMGGAGYFVEGTFLPTGDEVIVDWGYDEEDE